MLCHLFHFRQYWHTRQHALVDKPNTGHLLLLLNPMKTRASILIIACLMFHGLSFSATPRLADKPATVVKMDNKTVLIPEVKLNKKVNPVTSFLYIGSWVGGSKAWNAQKSSCTIVPEDNQILIKSPEKLLENSRTRVVTQNNVDPFLDGISWGEKQTSQIAFKVLSNRRQPAVIEVYVDTNAALFHNGKLVAQVSQVKDSGKDEYLPVMLEVGENVFNIKQDSTRGKPQIQMAVTLDHSHDLQAAWRPQNGLLRTLVCVPGDHTEVPSLDWSTQLGGFSISLEVRDTATNNIIFQKESAHRGPLISDGSIDLPVGIYEAAYKTRYEDASELFIVGNPDDVYEHLQDALSKYSTRYEADSSTKFAIEAQLRRAQILLLEKNYNIRDRQWQEKIVYTLNSLASIKRRLEGGAVNVTKDQPGLHIRGFASEADDSSQFYRLFVPSTYTPGTPLPLLVVASTRVGKKRPFVEGPVMANQREALLWSQFAEKYGFAILWPGYRGVPDGSSCESAHIDEAIQAVEQDYAVDKSRINVYARCGAGYNAGRLVSEYPNLFASIVYDRAVFNLKSSTNIESMKEQAIIDPVPQVLTNQNLKVFVMHDGSTKARHGGMNLTTEFLAQASASGKNVVSYLGNQHMGAAHIDQVFSWIASIKNTHPDDTYYNVAAKAGYTGPISKIFTTPILIVQGTHAAGHDQQNLFYIANSIRNNYMKRFHGAECAVKNDDDVTQEDINNHSLILIGNSRTNSVWNKLEPDIALKLTPARVMYKDDTLTGSNAFEAIVGHPYAANKYILMIGALDLRQLQRISTMNLFTASYDGFVFSSSPKIINKLEDPNGTVTVPAKQHYVKKKQPVNKNPPAR